MTTGCAVALRNMLISEAEVFEKGKLSVLKCKFVLFFSNFRETIILGYTDFTETEIKKMIHNLGGDYPGSTYHLYKK